MISPHPKAGVAFSLSRADSPPSGLSHPFRFNPFDSRWPRCVDFPGEHGE